jgi:hypothetical protein
MVAVEDLDRMMLTHSLPSDTKDRVKRSLRVLEQFPNIGRHTRWSLAPDALHPRTLEMDVDRLRLR